MLSTGKPHSSRAAIRPFHRKSELMQTGIQIPNAQIPQAACGRKAPTASSSVPYV